MSLIRDPQNRTVVFAAPRYQYMQNAFCSGGHFLRGNFNEGSHPNGEIWYSVPDPDMELARDRRVVILGSTDRNDFEAMLACGAELARVASEVNYVLCFARYATKERRDSYGDSVAAKNICQRISDAPAPGIRVRVFFFDLHAAQMEFYCDLRNIVTEHLYAHPLWVDLIRANTGEGKLFGANIAIGSADYGRKNAVIALAEALGVPYGLVAKERVSGSETHVIGDVFGDVKDRTVILFDDMLRRGTTTLGGAEAHIKAGAKAVWPLVTHPDIVGDSLTTLKDSGLFAGIICGDTYPSYQAAEAYPGFVHVIPTGHYLANILATRYRL